MSFFPYLWRFSFYPATRRSSVGAAGLPAGTSACGSIIHIYEHIFRLLHTVHVECHARSHGPRTCTWWEQLRLMMFTAPPPDRNDGLLIQPTSCLCCQTGPWGGVNTTKRRDHNSREKLGGREETEMFLRRRTTRAGRQASRRRGCKCSICMYAEQDEEEGGQGRGAPI